MGTVATEIVVFSLGEFVHSQHSAAPNTRTAFDLIAANGTGTLEINVGFVRAVGAGVDRPILTPILESYIGFGCKRVGEYGNNNLFGFEPRPACTTMQLSAALDRIGRIDLLHKI